MTDTPGFILLARDLLTKSVFKGDPEMLKLWIYILLRANFGEKSYTYNGVEVRRGQFLRSYRKIAKDNAYVVRNERVEWSPGKVERMLKALERDGRIRFIKHNVENVGTLIEVVNYASRQAAQSYAKELASEPPVANGKGHAKELWSIWLEELSPKGPHPSLTTKRKQVLNALYDEHLAKADGEPSVLFRGIIHALKASEFHIAKRQYTMPESFLRSPERRESWYLRSLENQSQTKHKASVSLADIWRDDE